MFKGLYQKSLSLASHKSSKFFLAIISFVESSFFPIPPDIMIIPMVIAKKTDYIKIFLVATIFSALGGLLGYFIGTYFLEIAMKVLEFYEYENQVINLKTSLSEGTGLYIWLATLFLAGFTPLPFKVFTITSGIISLNLLIFFFTCLLARGLRFFIVAYLSFKFGSIVNKIMKKEGAKLFSIIGILIITILTFIYFTIK